MTSNMIKAVTGHLHDRAVMNRRVSVLARSVAALLPPDARVLDVGCGDGQVALEVMRLRPDVVIEGVDVLVRPTTAIPVTQFDGDHIPLGDGGADTVMLIDVVHHARRPTSLPR